MVYSFISNWGKLLTVAWEGCSIKEPFLKFSKQKLNIHVEEYELYFSWDPGGYNLIEYKLGLRNLGVTVNILKILVLKFSRGVIDYSL